MKISKLSDGTPVYIHNYKEYKITLTLKDDMLTDFVVVNPNGEYLISGDIYDDKNPNGMPNTKHFRKKIKTELEELLDEDVINIGQEIMNEIDEEV